MNLSFVFMVSYRQRSTPISLLNLNAKRFPDQSKPLSGKLVIERKHLLSGYTSVPNRRLNIEEKGSSEYQQHSEHEHGKSERPCQKSTANRQ
jgi:hypothetical protein